VVGQGGAVWPIYAAASQAQRGQLVALPLDAHDADGRLLGDVEAHVQGGQYRVDCESAADRLRALVADLVFAEDEGFSAPC